VSKRANGNYQLLISSNVAEDLFVITATKKGAKAITYRVTTNEAGDISVITSRKLAGFTLTLRLNGDYMDRVKAK
jgi:hypothetical protein